MNAALHITLLVLSVIFIRPASGDTSYRSKLGIDLRGVKPNLQREMGWVAGIRTARFIGTSNAYFGAAGYYGSPQGGDPKENNTWYAGLTLGYDGRLGKTGIYEVGILAGMGAGKARNLEQTSYYVVEPSLQAGFHLGGGFRITAGVSYVHMTNAAVFSGPTFGFRIEYKTQTVVKEIDD